MNYKLQLTYINNSSETMKFTTEELIKVTNAVILRQSRGFAVEKFSISTDTRKMSPNDFYLPLIGESFNGHDFIPQALASGVIGYFTSNKHIEIEEADLILYVPNTLEAYLKLAQYYKRKINPKTIAVTGSSGKTTTKEMMAQVCSKAFRTHKSLLNHNNEIGLAQTLLSMPEDTEVLIVEMGMRGLGEIELLAKYAEPDIAVITNIGTAHLGRLGTVENIAKAKCEITKYLKKDGLLICADSDLARKHSCHKDATIYVDLQKLIDSYQLVITKMTQENSRFVYKDYSYKLNIEGEYNILNSVFVIEAAKKLGIPPEKIAAGLLEYKPIENRWQLEDCNGFKIINDSYNANPDSVKAALKAFLSLYKPPLAVVLGNMNELGENEKKYHQEIGQFLNQYKPELLITVGSLAKIIAENTNWQSVCFGDTVTAAEYIKNNLPKNTTILLKASRSLKFEKIIEEMKKQ